MNGRTGFPFDTERLGRSRSREPETAAFLSEREPDDGINFGRTL